MDHAGAEEVAGRCGLGRRLHHPGGGRPGLDRQRAKQPRVDLKAVEAGHQHPRGELGQLAGHADEHHPCHPGVRAAPHGDPVKSPTSTRHIG